MYLYKLSNSLKTNYYIFVVFLFFSCTGSTSTKSDVDEISNIIDLNAGLKNIQTVRLSDIADSITFLPLETTQESILGRLGSSFTPNYIFCWNKYFDWNGKYLGSIGSTGNGPFEETWGVLGMIFSDNHFYSTASKFIEYDITGKPTGKVRNLFDATDMNSGTQKFMWGSGLFNVGDHFGIYDYPTTIYFINKNFETISSREVFKADTLPPVLQPVANRAFQTRYKDNVLFYNFINDTIFYVKDLSLEPKWIVSFEGRSRISTELIINETMLTVKAVRAFRGGKSYENSELIKMSDDKHIVTAIYETELYLFFYMTEVVFFPLPRGKERAEPYIVYYEKRTGNTIRVKGKGFVDDMLGFDFFFPNSDTNDNQLVTSIWPYEIFDYIKECKEKGREVNPRLLALSKQVKEEDNPVLIFVHLKK